MSDIERNVLVLCPMRIELGHVARSLTRANLTEHAGVAIYQTGIGKDAVLRTLDTHARNATSNTLFILAGAAGGLVDMDDHVPPIGAVIDEHGTSWTPAGAPVGVTVIGVDRIVEGPRDKRELAQTTGASIVDMECHAFALACEARRLHWTIVRGVSDTPDEILPAEVLGWISPEGNTRNLRAALDMLRKPSLVPHIAGVMKRSNRVLPRVGDRVAALAHAWLRHGSLGDVK